MSAIANQNSRIGWLLGRLANRRNRITDLIRRLTGLGHAAGLKPSLFAKFLHMMDDVAAVTREQNALIGEIEKMEQKHKLMRMRKALKHAAPLPKSANSNEPAESKIEPPQRSQKLLNLLVLWYLFMRHKINNKKQGLTAD